MGTIMYKVNQKSGDYVKVAVVPLNHSQQPHIGVVDGVIIGVLLLCALGLLGLLVLS